MQTPRFSRLSPVVLLLVFTVGCGATAVQPDNDASAGGNNNEAGVATDTGFRGDAGRPQDEESIPAVDVPLTPVDVPPTMPVDAGPVTECDPANNGLACSPPGMGCGGGGGGLCSTSFSCNCGRDRRWSCQVTVPPGCDGGVSPSDAQIPPDDAIAPPQDAGPPPVCTLPGTYRASFEGVDLYFTFTPDGRWLGSDTPGGTPIVEGAYTLTGDRLTISDEQSRGGDGCAASDRGVYRVLFRPGCTELRLSLVSEDCGERGDTLGMLLFTRQ